MSTNQDQSNTTPSNLATSSDLWLGWPALYMVTIAQTTVMLGKLFRRQRGYQV